MLKYIKLFCFFVIFMGNAMAYAEIVSLPRPEMKSIPLNQAIQKRRSVRQFNSQKELSLSQISQLLWSAQGITDTTQHFRSAPSAGALYPLEIYVVKQDGLWHYIVNKHALEQISKMDLRKSLSNAALGQKEMIDAPATIVIVGVYQRSVIKYGKRGIQYTHIEVGHAAQNLVLEAINLNLASVTIGAFDEEKVKQLFSLSKEMTPLYLIPVGYKS